MNTLQGNGWSIDILPEWIGEFEEECVTIYHPYGVGALQISSYKKDTDVTRDDLNELAYEHLEEGARVSDAEAGDFTGITLAFGVDGGFWKHWYVANGQRALFVTYNCEDGDKNVEIDQIKSMVTSLRAI